MKQKAGRGNCSKSQQLLGKPVWNNESFICWRIKSTSVVQWIQEKLTGLSCVFQRYDNFLKYFLNIGMHHYSGGTNTKIPKFEPLKLQQGHRQKNFLNFLPMPNFELFELSLSYSCMSKTKPNPNLSKRLNFKSSSH